VALIALWCLIAPPVSSVGDQSPHELYDALNALRIDPATTYQLVAAIALNSAVATSRFSREGKLAFLAPIDGRVTGFVFSGRGHTLAFPRDVVEKQQMAHFLGAPFWTRNSSVPMCASPTMPLTISSISSIPPVSLRS